MHIKPGQQLSGLAEKQREKSCSFCWHLWFLPSLPSVRIHAIRWGFRGLTQTIPLCPALPSLRFGLCHPQPRACRYRTREPPHNINRAWGACIWCASGQDPSVAPGDLQGAQRREQDNFYWNSSIGTIPSVYPNLTWGKYLLKHKSCLNLSQPELPAPHYLGNGLQTDYFLFQLQANADKCISCCSARDQQVR